MHHRDKEHTKSRAHGAVRAPTLEDDLAQSPTPSKFPALVDAIPSVRSRRSTPIPTHEVLGLGHFCEIRDIAFTDILQLTWAILLRCYTGSDRVGFDSREQVNSGGDGEQANHMYSVDFRAAEPLSSLLQRNNKSSLHDTGHLDVRSNTLLSSFLPENLESPAFSIANDDDRVCLTG